MDNKLNTWVDNVKTESQYDALGREILAVSYQWDSKGKIWNPVSKKEIEFDDKNNPIITRSYSFYLEKWVLSEALECRFEKR